MSQLLISRSPDLKRLRDEGYEIEVYGGYLIIHHIPYVNNKREVLFGKLIVQLTINNNIVMKPNTHVIHFMGDYPCSKDGVMIETIRHSSPNKSLNNGMIMNHSFSNKPPNGYKDHYEQVTRYIEIISSEAKSLDNSVTAQTFKVRNDNDENNVFCFTDTHESRANIAHINNKVRGQKIAIIGLGGTGAYILDLISKTPVAEVHLFDGDYFYHHNAFRAPGAPLKDVFNQDMNKVDYYYSQYSNIHKHLFPHFEYITEDNIQVLSEMSFVFVCVDKNNARYFISKYLIGAKIPFIDVGLGVNVVDDFLIGQVRTTTVIPGKNDHLEKSMLSEDENDNNEYSSNIQIADLNALNAIFAVIKWKKLNGFYQDLIRECNTVYSVNNNTLINEDFYP